MVFGLAFEEVKKENGTLFEMRLPEWKPDVGIRAQYPDEHSKMTAPYLYVQSRFGRVPWKETMIELFSDKWEVRPIVSQGLFMKGNSTIIDTLNKLLIAEQTAYVQYRFSGTWNKIYGYNELAEMFFERARDEKKHHNLLMSRLLLLEGLPVIDTVDNPKQAVDIRTQFDNDLQLELIAVQDYNNAIAEMITQGDHATRKILDHILEEESTHIEEIEAIIKKIDDMGVQGFLQSFGK